MEDAKPQILLWTVPECPFRITILAAVLNEVRILSVEAFYSVPRGGVEVGGVFLGVREPDAIHIQAHRQIRCEYATGPSFTLSVKDQLGLSGLLDQAHTDPDLAGMTVLGWYHSHTRSELYLSPADLKFYNEFFHERWQIALVLRPANLQSTRAGFFFRDRRGSLKSDAPVHEFRLEPPAFGLDAIELRNGAAPREVRVSPAKAHVDPPAPASPPLIASATVAAGTMSSSSAIALVPETVVAPETSLPPTTPDPAVTISVSAGNGVAANVSEELFEGTPDVAREPLPQPDPEKEVEPGLHSFNLAESVVREKRRYGWIWALAIIILLVAGGSAAFLKWGRMAKPMELGLETYDINGAFLIRWDRGSSAILNATSATLEIDDGGEKIPIELGAGELAAGGYGYMRRTARISVHLKVDGPTPLEEYSNFEGVEALDSRPPESPEASHDLNRLLKEKEHLKTELINESMRSSDLRREITSLRTQLDEERAKNASTPGR